MKKRFISLLVSLLVLTALVLPAGAASVDLADPEALLPVDIIIDQDSREIRKVYDLSPNTDPATLPMEAFERDGSRYECTDILREVVIGSETQTITQTETVDSAKKDMETVLELLPQEKETTTEDGFTGTLHLVLDSIKTEPAGYGSSTKPVTATRSYPNLASADANHLPKTITEGGRTLKLQDIQWQTDNTYNADDYEIGDRFSYLRHRQKLQRREKLYIPGLRTVARWKHPVQVQGQIPGNQGMDIPGIRPGRARLANRAGEAEPWTSYKKPLQYRAQRQGGPTR